MKMQGPLVKNCKDSHGGDTRALTKGSEFQGPQDPAVHQFRFLSPATSYTFTDERCGSLSKSVILATQIHQHAKHYLAWRRSSTISPGSLALPGTAEIQ